MRHVLLFPFIQGEPRGSRDQPTKMWQSQNLNPGPPSIGPIPEYADSNPSNKLDPKTPMVLRKITKHPNCCFSWRVHFCLAISDGFSAIISAFSLEASPTRMGMPQMPMTMLLSTLAKGLSERRRGPPHPPGWRDSTTLTLGGRETLDPWLRS